MRYLTSGSLLLAAIIHLLPLAGVLGHERLATLYGIDAADPNLSILLRHRAVLFGLLGAFLLVAAFRPGWQAAAFVAGLVSVVSFLLLAWSTGGYNALIGRVVAADLVALVALLAGAVAWWQSAT
jgi:hypothetical protein